MYYRRGLEAAVVWLNEWHNPFVHSAGARGHPLLMAIVNKQRRHLFSAFGNILKNPKEETAPLQRKIPCFKTVRPISNNSILEIFHWLQVECCISLRKPVNKFFRLSFACLTFWEYSIRVPEQSVQTNAGSQSWICWAP